SKSIVATGASVAAGAALGSRVGITSPGPPATAHGVAGPGTIPKPSPGMSVASAPAEPAVAAGEPSAPTAVGAGAGVAGLMPKINNPTPAANPTVNNRKGIIPTRNRFDGFESAASVGFWLGSSTFTCEV